MLGIYVDARGNTFKFAADEARRRGLRLYTDEDRAAAQAASAAKVAARSGRVGTPSAKMIAGAENKGA